MTPLEQFDLMSGPLAKFPTVLARTAEEPFEFGPRTYYVDKNEEGIEDEMKAYLATRAGMAAQRMFVKRLMVPNFWTGHDKGFTLAIGRAQYDENCDLHVYDGQPPSGAVLDLIGTNQETGEFVFECPRGELRGAIGAVKVERDIEFIEGTDADGKDTLAIKAWVKLYADPTLAIYIA